MNNRWAGKLAAFGVIAFCVLVFTSSVEANKDSLPRVSGGALLVGHFPDNLAVTVGEKTTEIEGAGGWEVLPSLSADGRMVASARPLPTRAADTNQTFVVGTFDLAGGGWKLYRDLKIKGGAVAISPDGSKLVCSKMAEGDSLIHILDLKTGRIWVGPESTKDAVYLSWSPDSRRLVFNREVQEGTEGAPQSLLPEIYVLSVDDGRVSKIAEGSAPSWSPSGEWIAFSDYSVFRHGKYADTAFCLSLIHPDGTGSVALIHRSEDLMLPAVWSPDSKRLLLQRRQDDEANPKVTIYELNLATRTLTAKFRNTPEIYGWATAE